MPRPASHKTLADMKGEERELDKERKKRKVGGKRGREKESRSETTIVATSRPNLSLQYDKSGVI